MSIKKRSRALAAVIADHGPAPAHNELDATVRDKLEAIPVGQCLLLVQIDKESSEHFYSLHSTLAEAGRYALCDEDDWRICCAIDLDTGEVHHAATEIRW